MQAPTASVDLLQRRKRPLRMLGTVCPKHVNKAFPPKEHPVNVALSVRNSVIILFFLSAAEAKDATKVRTFYGLTKKNPEKVCFISHEDTEGKAMVTLGLLFMFRLLIVNKNLETPFLIKILLSEY